MIFTAEGHKVFSDTDGAYQPYPATRESGLPLDVTTPMASHEAGAWGHVDPPAPRPTGGVGDEGTTELSAGSPPIWIVNVGSQNPKKRKRATIPDETRKVTTAP